MDNLYYGIMNSDVTGQSGNNIEFSIMIVMSGLGLTVKHATSIGCECKYRYLMELCSMSSGL